MVRAFGRVLTLVALLPAGAPADPVDAACEDGAPRLCLLADGEASSALVVLTLPVGSADERAGEHGVAHYLEHLLYGNRTAEGEAVGGGIDRWGNAYTDTRATAYHWEVPPDRLNDALARALEVLAPFDVPAEVARREREIVLREREERIAGPHDRLFEAAIAALYEGTPLARTVIGRPDEIASLGLDDARAFHERHYRAAGATLVVAGDVAPRAVRAEVERLAAGLDPGGPRPDPPALDLARRPPQALRIQDGFGAIERSMDLVARTEAGPAALAVLDAWLASSLPGAPGPVLVRGRDDLSGFEAGVWEVEPGWAALGATATLRPGREAAALDAPWAAWKALLAGLGRDGLDEATVERLRARILRSVEGDRDDAVAAAWDLVGWIQAGSDLSAWHAYPDALDAVSAADIRALLDALARPARVLTIDAVPGPRATE